MNDDQHNHLVQNAFQQMQSDSMIDSYLDHARPIPQYYRGTGKIRLIILGQDPTVKNTKARDSIRTVLNLDRSGSLKTYLSLICGLLGVDLETEVFATNLFKNFFVEPPTRIDPAIHIFDRCLPYWLPILRAELDEFHGVPVLALGEPLLRVLTCNGADARMKHYWGHQRDWQMAGHRPFAFLPLDKNILKRVVLPFPHQPTGQRNRYYIDQMATYSSFVRPLIP